MSAIDVYVEQIRNAIFGKDVREAIANGIETCYSDVSMIEGIASFVGYSNINTFIATPAYVEIGNPTANVTLSWTFNSEPTRIAVNGYEQSLSARSLAVTPYDNGTHEATYTLTTNLGSKTTKFKFLNKVFYGVAAAPGTVDGAFVTGLSTSEYTDTKARTKTFSVGSNKYIWYASPVRFGACSFKVGGFDGGFESPDTVSVTNGSGYTENYYVYRSTNSSLGSTTVTVS